LTIEFQLVFSCFAVVFLASAEGKTVKKPTNPIRLEDILTSKYAAAGYGGRWTSGKFPKLKNHHSILESK